MPDLTTGTKVSLTDPVTGKVKKGMVYGSSHAIDGVTGTFTKVAWDDQKNKWTVVQHFPLAEGWDNTTKKYLDPTLIQTSVKLP